MKKVLISSVAIAAAVSASAQSSSTQAPSVSTSRATVAAPAAQKPSAWSGGISVLVETPAYQRDPKNVNSPLFDRDAVYYDSLTSLSAGYKFSNGHSLQAVQRIAYSQSIDSDHQFNAVLTDLRFHYKIPMSLAGGQGAMILRVAPATTYATIVDDNRLGTIALMPALSWELTPRMSVSYNGYFGGTFWNGARRDLTDYHHRVIGDLYSDGYNVATSAAKATYAKNYNSMIKKQNLSAMSEEQKISVIQATEANARAQTASDLSNARRVSWMTQPADQRNFYVIANTAALNYKVNDKWGVSQSLGYTYVGRNYRNTSPDVKSDSTFVEGPFKNSSAMYMDLGTSVSWAPLKNVSVDLGVAQQHPFLPGSSDPILGKPIQWRDGFSPYIAEQTKFTLNTGVRF